ncbi:MAG: Uma2 family endonuclease [Planctomycetaceae bacterium]
MSVTTHPLTAEALFTISSTLGRAELIDGELVRMRPAGFEHGSITLKLVWPIARYVEEHQLGIVCAAETGFLLKRNPDTVRAFVSPNDTSSEVQAKALAWIEAGCRVVWIVDPKLKHVTEFRSETLIRVFTVKDRLAASEIFGDWSIEVGKLFQ